MGCTVQTAAIEGALASLEWLHAFAKGGCRDVRPAAQ
jgi:hypothetical protein